MSYPVCYARSRELKLAQTPVAGGGGGGGLTAETKMNASIQEYLSSLRLGEPQTHRNIVVFPLIGSTYGDSRWLTLGEALEQQLLSVTEVSQGGSVPELIVINRADRPVLLLDGEELIGAKQNRVLNTTILLKEKSETVVPVSCTERGRWSYVSAALADAKVVMASKVRAQKMKSVSESLAAAAGYKSDQGEVWEEIAALHAKAGTNSPTGAMHDVFKARERELEDWLRTFAPVPEQTGLLLVIDGEVVGFDFIPDPRVYALEHSKLVKSYIIEALAQPDRGSADLDAARTRATSFLSEVSGCAERTFASIGYGTDCRYQKPGLAGAALMHDDKVVHTAFFRLVEAEQPGRPISPPRRRRFVE